MKMGADKKKVPPFTDINGMVAVILDDVADRPVPRAAKARVAEIREAVAKGIATIDMALDIIRLFPYDKAA